MTFGEPRSISTSSASFKDGVVAKLTGGLGQLSKQRKITYMQGRGTFVDPQTLERAPTADGASETRRLRARDHRDGFAPDEGPGCCRSTARA